MAKTQLIRTLAAKLKEREAALDAGGAVVSLAELDQEIEARKRREMAVRLFQGNMLKHEAAMKNVG